MYAGGLDFCEHAVVLAGDDVEAGNLVADAAVKHKGIPLVENHVLGGDHVQRAQVRNLAGDCEKKKLCFNFIFYMTMMFFVL